MNTPHLPHTIFYVYKPIRFSEWETFWRICSQNSLVSYPCVCEVCVFNTCMHLCAPCMHRTGVFCKSYEDSLQIRICILWGCLSCLVLVMVLRRLRRCWRFLWQSLHIQLPPLLTLPLILHHRWKSSPHPADAFRFKTFFFIIPTPRELRRRRRRRRSDKTTTFIDDGKKNRPLLLTLENKTYKERTYRVGPAHTGKCMHAHAHAYLFHYPTACRSRSY